MKVCTLITCWLFALIFGDAITAKLHKLCHCQKTYGLNWMCTSLKNVNDGWMCVNLRKKAFKSRKSCLCEWGIKSSNRAQNCHIRTTSFNTEETTNQGEGYCWLTNHSVVNILQGYPGNQSLFSQFSQRHCATLWIWWEQSGVRLRLLCLHYAVKL